jgi:uncharacterized membrane protein YGL010W
MKSMQQWLDEYGESHKNATNKLIHFICVPTIFFTVVGLLFSIKLPFAVPYFAQGLNVAHVILVAVFVYYVVLSLPISIGMFLFGIVCLFLCEYIEVLNFMPLWAFSLLIFTLAWIAQFYGHKIEGKKPSFLKDLQFLMIGPAWIMSFILSKVGIKY